MNEFEKRMNALRIQFRNERVEISKATARTIGHLNSAIGQVTTSEARDALRAERTRIADAGRRSIESSRLCYAQLLEAVEDEYRLYLERNPSKHQVRRLLSQLYNYAKVRGQSDLNLSFGDNLHAEVKFNF